MANKRVSLLPDPREDPKRRSLNEGSYKVPLVVWGPKLGDLLFRSSRGSGLRQLKLCSVKRTQPRTSGNPLSCSSAFWQLRLLGFRVWGFRGFRDLGG